MSEMVSPYNIYTSYGVRPSYNPEGEEYLYNTIKNLQERVKLLEENVDKLIKKHVGAPPEPAKDFLKDCVKDFEEFYKKFGTYCSQDGAIIAQNAEPNSTIYGTHTFLDCAERVKAFYDK